MKVVFIQNTLFNHKRFMAGESVDISEKEARFLSRAKLANVESTPATPVSVSSSVVDTTPKKRTTKKTKAKTK
jgi:hypothetical protein